MTTCKNCKFYRNCGYMNPGEGFCEIDLPPWLDNAIRDLSQGNRVVGEISGCSLGKPIVGGQEHD